MSTLRSDLAVSFPAISPDISAEVMDSLCAAVPRPANANGSDNSFGRDATLISEVDAFHPRDLEETVLTAQVLAAHHSAMACFSGAAQLDPASKEASRLRRDAIALQRSLAAMVRALHRSQARPVQDDDVGLVPRPTVPVAIPPARRRPARQQQRAADPSNAGPPRELDAPPDQHAAPEAATAPAAGNGAASQSVPPQRKNPFEGHPDLQRLHDRWDSLPRWEKMTKEERREPFSYKYTPPKADEPDDPKPVS